MKLTLTDDSGRVAIWHIDDKDIFHRSMSEAEKRNSFYVLREEISRMVSVEPSIKE